MNSLNPTLRLRTMQGNLTSLATVELCPLIALGTMVHQRGYREFEASRTADLLIKMLKQGGSA